MVTEVHREVSHITYSKEALLSWKQARMLDNTMKRILHSIPSSLRRRKRGKRAVLRSRLRKRKCKLPLPTIISGNVRSVSKQYTEVLECVKCLQDYRNACGFCLTETWLHPGILDSAVEIEGFHLFRMDRTEDSSKQKGGGVYAYINSNWCNNSTVKLSTCSENLELLSLVCRPYYLPREISCIVLIVVYIPGKGNHSIAADNIMEHVNLLETSHPDSAILITGDFNWCDIGESLPRFNQFVDFPTREDNILDLFYCNIKHSYKVRKYP